MGLGLERLTELNAFDVSNEDRMGDGVGCAYLFCSAVRGRGRRGKHSQI